MGKCDVELTLDPRNSFRAGDVIRGAVTLNAAEPIHTKGVTVEIGWRVRGRGNPGSAVVQSITLHSGQISGRDTLPFEVKAPNGPISHRGELIEIAWYARARVDVDWAIDPKSEVSFDLLPASNCTEPYVHGSEPPDLGPDSAKTGRPIPWPAVWVLGGFGIVGVLFLVRGMTIREGGLILFGAIFTLIGTLGLVMGLRLPRRIAAARLGEVKVHVQKLQPRGGENVRVTVEILPKHGARVDGAHLDLHGYERAVRGTGKNRRTTVHNLHQSSHLLHGDLGTLIPGVVSRWTADVPIPAGAAPTFLESDNRIAWEMGIRLNLPSHPDWKDTVTLGVVPKAIEAMGSNVDM